MCNFCIHLSGPVCADTRRVCAGSCCANAEVCTRSGCTVGAPAATDTDGAIRVRAAEITAFARAAGAPTVQPERVHTSALAQHEPAQTLRVSAANRAGQWMQQLHMSMQSCVRADCVACDYPARRNRDRGAGGESRRRIDQRCRQSIWDQLPDCAADRGGCRRASAGTARGGFLRRFFSITTSGSVGGTSRAARRSRRSRPGRRTRHSHRRSPSRGIRPQPVSGGAPRGADGRTALPQS